MTVSVPRSYCPVCSLKLGAATYIHDFDAPIQPGAGDVTVCIGCSAFLTYTDDLTLRLMQHEEVADLPDLPRDELMRVRRALERCKQERPDLAQSIAADIERSKREREGAK